MISKPMTLGAGLTIRPAAERDFDAVLALISAQNTADYGEPMISADVLRTHWETSGLDLARDTWVALAPAGGLAGYAEIVTESPTEFEPALYLASEAQHETIGVDLMHRAEARAAAGQAVSVALTSRVSERNALGKRLFEQAGYARRWSFLMMERVAAQAPEPAHWAPGMTVRTFRPGQDERVTYQADEEASADKGYHAPLTFEAWAERMGRYAADFDPSLWFLACDGEQVAGVALNVDSPATGAGWIDHLGVRRPWRNRGLGKALLLHSLNAFHQRGRERVRLNVDSRSLTNAPRLYERAGLRTVQQYHIYRKELSLRPFGK